MRRIALVLTLVLLPRVAAAQCSGSGLTWSCTAGSSEAQIESAIGSASDGATITLAAGSYSAGNINLDNRNGVTLICATTPPTQGAATSGGCNMSAARVMVSWHTGVKTGVTRISGFNFTTTSASNVIDFSASGSPSFSQIRIDHNTFNNTGVSVWFGWQSTTAPSPIGVIDHNVFQGSTIGHSFLIQGSDTNGQYQGTANNLFFEDNSWNYSTGGFNNVSIDAWPGGRVVIRTNTFHNARVSVHGRDHEGPINFEAYSNTFTNSTDCYRSLHHQGMAEMLAFDNVFPATSCPNGEVIGFLHYRSSANAATGICDGTKGIDGNRTPLASYRGYPCDRQPGRDGNGLLRPVYTWLNRTPGGAQVTYGWGDATGSPSYLSLHLVQNRDWYEAVSATAQTSSTSPFNGTVGVGFGTLANRPTTCTANSEAGDAGQGGVGYWATDVGVWNRTLAGASGRLYRCSATNTWSVGYTPYAYPHPLRAAERGTPVSPTNVRVQ